SVVPRDATLNSMTFSITGPDGKTVMLKPKVTAPKGVTPVAFFNQPTFMLTLSSDGIEEQGGIKGAWADGQKAKLDAAGVYTIKIKGSIVRQKGEPIAFEAGPISMQLGTRDIKTLAQVETIAREALQKKGYKLNDGIQSLVENEDGARLVKIQGPAPMPPA